MATFASASASAGLLHAPVPLDEPPNLTLRVAAFDHARDKLAVLLFGIAVLFRSERDHRKQVFDLREDSLLDDLADLFIAGPSGILSTVVSPRPQGELDDLVAEILGVRNARRLFYLGQFLIEQLAIEQLAGVGILEILVLDPGIRIINIAIEQILAVVRIRLEIGLLNLVTDKFGISRRQFGLDDYEVTLFHLVGKLFAPYRLLQRIHQVNRVGAKLGGIVIVRRGEHLEGEMGRKAVHAFIDPGSILVLLDASRFGIGFLQALAVIDPHLGK